MYAAAKLTSHEIDEQGRTELPLVANDVDTLLGFLDYQRATLEWKTSGLDAEGLGATLLPKLHPTTMTLSGILKHLAWVEDYWFSARMLGNSPFDYWADVDWNVDEGLEWSSAAEDSPEQLRMIEEYARHNGHADLLRESVDG